MPDSDGAVKVMVALGIPDVHPKVPRNADAPVKMMSPPSVSSREPAAIVVVATTVKVLPDAMWVVSVPLIMFSEAHEIKPALRSANDRQKS